MTIRKASHLSDLCKATIYSSIKSSLPFVSLKPGVSAKITASYGPILHIDFKNLVF
jgi:hypothetical protein